MGSNINAMLPVRSPNAELYLQNCVIFEMNPRIAGISRQRIFGGRLKILETSNCDIIGSGFTFAGSGILYVDAQNNRWWNIKGLHSNGPNAAGSYGWDAHVTE